MLLLADGLFRLDVVIDGDTLRTIVRNLSAGRLDIARGHSGEAPAAIAFGEIDPYQPGHARLDFSLTDPAGSVTVGATIGTLSQPDRGLVRVSVQAIVRPPEAAAAPT